MKENQKKLVKGVFEGAMWVLIIFGMVATYYAGLQNGKLELCENMDMVLVAEQGIYTCWDEMRLEERKKQLISMDGGVALDGIQYNFTQ